MALIIFCTNQLWRTQYQAPLPSIIPDIIFWTITLICTIHFGCKKGHVGLRLFLNIMQTWKNYLIAWNRFFYKFFFRHLVVRLLFSTILYCFDWNWCFRSNINIFFITGNCLCRIENIVKNCVFPNFLLKFRTLKIFRQITKKQKIFSVNFQFADD